MASENFERSTMEARLNRELHAFLFPTRERLELTQSAMAKRYFMAKNTYWDLETDASHGFGLLTAVLLLHDQDDPKKVLDDLYDKMMIALEEVTVLV